MTADLTNVTTHELNGIRYLEYLTRADEAQGDLPCMLVLHWMSGDPQAMLPICAPFTKPARFLIPFGPHRLGAGYTWFTGELYDLPLAEQGALIRETAARLAEFLQAATERTPCQGKPAVLGMSQGGDLSFALAVYHPESISLAMPMAGRLLPEFLPAALPDQPRPEVWIFHGATDQVVPIAFAQEAADWLEANGFPCKLYSYPGVGHDITREMVVDMHQKLM